MNRLLISALIFVILSSFYSAVPFADKKETFKKNNIYIVYTGKPKVDSAFRHSLSRIQLPNLKGVASSEEFEELIKDKNNSFIYAATWIYNASGMTMNTRRSTAALVCFNGGKKNIGKYNFFSDAVYTTPFNHMGDENNFENSSYRIPLMLEEINAFLQEEKDSPKPVVRWNKKVALVKESQVNGDKFPSGAIQKEALSLLPGKYEIVNEKRIEEMIAAKDKKYALLTPASSDDGSVIRLTDLETGQFVGASRNSTIFKFPWVREKEITALVDAMYK